MTEEKAFPCTGCGACCLMLGGKMFPPFLKPAEDGSCPNLAPDRKTCMVYENRPRWCYINDMRPKIPWVGIPLLTMNAWHKINIACCKKLRKKFGIPEGEEQK